MKKVAESEPSDISLSEDSSPEIQQASPPKKEVKPTTAPVSGKREAPEKAAPAVKPKKPEVFYFDFLKRKIGKEGNKKRSQKGSQKRS